MTVAVAFVLLLNEMYEAKVYPVNLPDVPTAARLERAEDRVDEKVNNRQYFNTVIEPDQQNDGETNNWETENEEEQEDEEKAPKGKSNAAHP